MANLREIKNHINNVNATKKITRAMYLISASNSRKAKTQLENALPYFRQVRTTLADILAGAGDLNTPYIRRRADALPGERSGGRSLYLVLGSDKGMAGGYNQNILGKVKEYADKARDDLIVAGLTGYAQLCQEKYRVDKALKYPVMNPVVSRARELAEIIASRYLDGGYDAAYVIYTELITPLKQVPTRLQLLPLDTAALGGYAPAARQEIEYLPSAREMFDHLTPHYLKGILYSAFVEAFASEQHARMYAMNGAVKNANDTIARLSISYNRARQARITQELTEIVSGIPEA